MFNQSWPVLWISIDVISFHSTRFSLSEEKRRKEKPPSMSLDPSVSSTPSPSEVLAPLHIGCAVVTGNESNKKKEMRFEVYTVFSSPVSLPIVSRPLQVFPFFFFIFSFLLRWWLASVMSRQYVMPDITDFRGWSNDRFFDVDVGRGVVYLRPDWRGGAGGFGSNYAADAAAGEIARTGRVMASLCRPRNDRRGWLFLRSTARPSRPRSVGVYFLFLFFFFFFLGSPSPSPSSDRPTCRPLEICCFAVSFFFMSTEFDPGWFWFHSILKWWSVNENWFSLFDMDRNHNRLSEIDCKRLKNS